MRTPHPSIRSIRIPTNLARLPSWADRLESMDLPWRNDTPADRAVREARRALSKAERRHEAAVRERRRAVRKAERAHEQAVGRAQQEAFGPARVGLIIAGMEVPHCHLHVVPIDRESDLHFANADASVPAEVLDDAADRLRRAMGTQSTN